MVESRIKARTVTLKTRAFNRETEQVLMVWAPIHANKRPLEREGLLRPGKGAVTKEGSPAHQSGVKRAAGPHPAAPHPPPGLRHVLTCPRTCPLTLMDGQDCACSAWV